MYIIRVIYIICTPSTKPIMCCIEKSSPVYSCEYQYLVVYLR